MNKEIKKAEEVMAKEKNLNQISFYEGYIKGLKFAKQEIIDEVKELKKHLFIAESEGDGFNALEASGYRRAINEIINLIKNK